MSERFGQWLLVTALLHAITRSPLAPTSSNCIRLYHTQLLGVIDEEPQQHSSTWCYYGALPSVDNSLLLIVVLFWGISILHYYDMAAARCTMLMAAFLGPSFFLGSSPNNVPMNIGSFY
ncbi:hypothetical protein F5887DRAFT_950405 [Amanita rubescens]|nr:hypothetical protein F5887DRAFT_950405 [Amanita rubescens]